MRSDPRSPRITTATDAVHQPEQSVLHSHPAHELLWHVSGTFRVDAGDRTWSLAPGTGVWIAAGTMHRTVGSGDYQVGWALVETADCPEIWERTTPVLVEPLLHHLLHFLASERSEVVRSQAEDVVIDLLGAQLSSSVIELPMPSDARSRQIVDALLADPAHPWELADWAIEVGAGTRTLSRLFVDETGMSFGQWRTQARMRAAMADLVAGVPVQTVARRVGYASPSAFVTAFRRCTGRTPGSIGVEAPVLQVVS